MSSPTILVTPRSLTAGDLDDNPDLAPLRDAGYRLRSGPPGTAPTEDELVDLLPECRGYLAGIEPITERVLAAAPELAVISRNGVGVDAIDLHAAAHHGVEVVVARNANSQGVAELSLAHMINALRGFTEAVGSLRSGRWERHKGREIGGATVGIVGFGAIGRSVARACLALGATVVVHDPFVEPIAGVELVSLPELASRATVISLHCPPADAPIIDGNLLQVVRSGTILVNTARSTLVDDAAVLDALQDGRLGAYCVDAFASEPPDPSALLADTGVYSSPHIGGFTEESVTRATQYAVQNLLTALAARGGVRRAIAPLGADVQK